mmetsp:Transcript_44166/g.70772  ORF Transcript_44166/g.70772 Transcript_44166/m.70772 type:complete len:395 (+) Transcript_44166:38-1222(+)
MERLQRICNQLTPNQTAASHDNNNRLPTHMRALYKSQPTEGFDLVSNHPVPTPKSDELLVKSMAVAICGSDAKLYHWHNITDKVAKLPFIPGHEAAGQVVQVGDNIDAKQFCVGDRVAIENHFYCGQSTCIQCKSGRGDICPNMGQFGFGKGTPFGGCCEYFVVKAKYCYKLRTPFISWRDASLLEPLGVACNAIDELDIDYANNESYVSETYAVTGCGAVGLMVIAALKAVGICNIVAFDVLDWKLEIAKKMGASQVVNTRDMSNVQVAECVNKLTENHGFGRIVECSGNENVIALLFRMIRKGGKIVMVGLPKHKIVIEEAMNNWVLNAIQIRSIHGRKIFDSWRKAEKLVQEAKIDLDLVVSHFIPMTEFQRGYDDWFRGKACKVVFDPTK